MSSKSRLALLDDSNFPIALIEVGENIRDITEKEEGIKELADSIEQYGQLEPIGIEFDENENGKFKLVYGHRRLIAISKILKWKNVKVVRVSSDNRVETQLIENIHRKDLTDLELAEALKKIQEQAKSKGKELKNKELAKIVSKSVDWIETKLAHLEIYNSLDSESKEEAKEISTEKIKHLKHLSSENKKAIIQETKKNNLSVKKVIEKAKALSEKSVTSRNSVKVSKSEPSKADLKARLKEVKAEIKILQAEEKKLENQIGKLK